jgi:hypothetical protein
MQMICEQVKQWNGVATREDTLAFFDRLCENYLQAHPQLRGDIRQAVTGNPMAYQSLLYDSLGAVGVGPYLALAAERAEAERNYLAYLRLALLTISCTGGFGDWRDTIVWLGSLHEEARQRGIDARPHFEEIAALSDGENQHGISEMSTRDLILSGGGLCDLEGKVVEKTELLRRLGARPDAPFGSSATSPQGSPGPYGRRRPWWRFWG